jgi:LytS/YehU family sensor histidine kinase
MHAENLPFFVYIPYVFSAIYFIALFYFNYHVFIPRYYFTKKYLTYYAIIAVCLILLVIIPESDHLFEKGHPMNPHHFHQGKKIPHLQPHRLMRFSFFEMQIFLMGIMVLLTSMYLRITERLGEAEDEKVNAELSYLKAQINPHFLFNTLNSIYSLAYKKSDQTAQAIVKLSGLMRYVISDAQEDKVMLSKEVEYLTNYIELQKLRLTEKTKVIFDQQGVTEDKMIAPLLLLPFVENAFKYGSNPEHDSEIKIKLLVSDTSLQFDVKNDIVNLHDIPSERIGVGNAKERLALTYSGKYLLNIIPTQNQYLISLHINLS